jgi:hypothetical protein
VQAIIDGSPFELHGLEMLHSSQLRPLSVRIGWTGGPEATGEDILVDGWWTSAILSD